MQFAGVWRWFRKRRISVTILFESIRFIWFIGRRCEIHLCTRYASWSGSSSYQRHIVSGQRRRRWDQQPAFSIYLLLSCYHISPTCSLTTVPGIVYNAVTCELWFWAQNVKKQWGMFLLVVEHEIALFESSFLITQHESLRAELYGCMQQSSNTLSSISIFLGYFLRDKMRICKSVSHLFLWSRAFKIGSVLLCRGARAPAHHGLSAYQTSETRWHVFFILNVWLWFHYSNLQNRFAFCCYLCSSWWACFILKISFVPNLPHSFYIMQSKIENIF